MAEAKVNEDLVSERKQCSFDVKELTHVIDGGEHFTQDRKEVEKLLLSTKELRDVVPEEYLSYKERHENAVRKASILYKVYLDQIKNPTSKVDLTSSNVYQINYRMIKDNSPMFLNFAVFVSTVFNQASADQVVKWLDLDSKILGVYGQSELGHGTFLRGLETTATYDVDSEEFIIHSPTITAYKWWPGGLANIANHCIVMAQLYINGTCHGIHHFLVPIRDIDTHMPLPGIKVGDIGAKMGFQNSNNGFLGFDNCRIPRTNMLMKKMKVLKDGTYVNSKPGKSAYSSLVFTRVAILSDVAYELSKAVTIAVRYAAVRHQSRPKPEEPEPPILDYQTQQHKLFISIASSHAFRTCGVWLKDTYSKKNAFPGTEDNDLLPELHALACCLKAVCSRDATVFVEQCRLACGGHGYMVASNLPNLYGVVTATITYDGENTVMLLQTARYMMKAWRQACQGASPTPTVAYLMDYYNNNLGGWENSPDWIIRGFQSVAAGKTKAAYDSLQRHIMSGMHYEDAWNLTSVQLTNASEAHGRAVLCDVYWKETQRITSTVSKNLSQVLLQLVEFYLLYWALEMRGDILMYGRITKEDIEKLMRRYEELLALIRPNAVGLVDAFDIPDEILCSTLGSYDGRVYERMMEQAMKSPLNQEPVNQSFHKYIMPVLRQKL